MANRIQALANLIPNNSIVADIGTDHAYLIISLLLSKKILYAYAIDNKDGPIQNASNNLEKKGLLAKCKVIKANGLKFALDKKVDTLVFAGLGGINVTNIIQENIEKLKYIKYIVTDIHRDDANVKELLERLGYEIEEVVDIIDKKKKYHLVRYANK